MTTDYYIPSSRVYSEIEPAFMACTQGDYIIPVAWGPVSKVLGKCMDHRINTGQCIGTFYSKDVNASDTPWSCINEENKTTNVCSLGTGINLPAVAHQHPPPLSSKPTSNSPTVSSSGNTKPPNNQIISRSVKGLNQASKNYNQPISSLQPTDMKLSVNQGYKNPYLNGSYAQMSYSVFDSPYLSRGPQSTSDPAAYLTGVGSYVNLISRAQQSTILPNEPWGTCSSYGNYNSAPNASLSAGSVIGGSCIGGNCLEGDYTMSYQQAQKMLSSSY